MKKFLKVLLIIILILVVIVLVGALFMPKEINVEESVLINEKSEIIYDYVNCLEKTAIWSPWEGVSDVMFTGPKCGVGAKQEWMDPNGGGKQEIVDSKAFEYSKSILDFGPQGKAESEFILKPEEGGTKVTWTFKSEAKYPLGRIFGLFLVKPMIEDSYKKGLQSLDSLINTMPKASDLPAYDEPTEIDVESITMISIRENVSMDEIGPKMGEHYGEIGKFIGMNGLKMKGFPICIWHSWLETDNEMECAMFIDGEIEGNDIVTSSKSYGGKVLILDYYGAYDASPAGWQKIDDFILANGLEKNGNPWDEYITDPGVEQDTAKWLTRLYQPIK